MTGFLQIAPGCGDTGDVASLSEAVDSYPDVTDA